jgi:hypothetical protein
LLDYSILSVKQEVKANRAAKLLLLTLPKDVAYFLNEVDEELKNDGITLYISSGKHVKLDCGSCGGYFDSVGKTLAIAGNVDIQRFVSLLCHEYSHYKQYKDQNSIWHDEKINGGHSKFFYWLQGERHYKTFELVQACIKLELDCEKRAIKLIRRKFSHIVSPDDYQKRANAYLFGYLWVHSTGQWFKKKLYQQPILDACSSTLRRKYLTIPKKLRAAFEECL